MRYAAQADRLRDAWHRREEEATLVGCVCTLRREGALLHTDPSFVAAHVLGRAFFYWA